jgi:protein CpxP
MKKLILAILLAATAPAFAQQATEQQAPTQTTAAPASKKVHTPEEKATMTSNRMEKKLAITADQKKKIYDLALLRAQKADEVKAKHETDRALMHSEMKSIQTAFDSNLKDILTPEQYTKWKEEKGKK